VRERERERMWGRGVENRVRRAKWGGIRNENLNIISAKG